MGERHNNGGRGALFVAVARVETFRRATARMDRAVAINLEAPDAIKELQDAWDGLRPWLDCINVNPKGGPT